MFSTWSWQRRNCAMHLKLAKNCLRVGVGTWICFETVLPDLFKSRTSSFTSMLSSLDVPTVVFVTESNGCINLNHLNWSCMWTLCELLTLTQKLYLYINFCHVGWNFWQGTWKLLICFKCCIFIRMSGWWDRILSILNLDNPFSSIMSFKTTSEM